MASLITQCPHCMAEHVSMPVFGWKAPHHPTESAGYAFVAVLCPACDLPSSYKVAKTSTSWADFKQGLEKVAKTETAQLRAAGYGYGIVLPPEKRGAPEALPDNVLKAFGQAEDNFKRRGNEEPAAVFYGRAIELALKHVHPDVAGSLSQRISKLAADREIPLAMAEWAHEVRVIRNDGAHDDGVTRDDLVAARDFADAFLRYLISMPAMVAQRRAQPARSEPAAEG